ncbi:MAG: hypothetical protein H6719_01570 [Sandaracinaceae bacterium]|nr:hypothetical protein [Sandaracinaceae bacterium]
MKTTTKAVRLLAAWVTLLAILACGSGQSAEPTEEEQARSEALRTLESHLTEGQTYGEGPGGTELANLVRETVAPEDGVAVRIVPGNPRNVVVLIRYRSGGGYEDLREISVSERNEEIDRIVENIDGGYGARGENLAVAIRGSVFYGAVGVRQAGQAMQYHTGSVVSLSVIDPILTATPGEDVPVPTLALGAQVEGTVVGPPGNPPTYRLVLAQPSTVVTQLVTTQVEDGGPFMALCAGEQRGLICGDDPAIEPLDDFQSDNLDDLADRVDGQGRELDYFAYRLAAGTYTVVVYSNCDDEGPCPANGTAYTLLATDLRPNAAP